jgi:hypothetical protein
LLKLKTLKARGLSPGARLLLIVLIVVVAASIVAVALAAHGRAGAHQPRPARGVDHAACVIIRNGVLSACPGFPPPQQQH